MTSALHPSFTLLTGFPGFLGSELLLRDLKSGEGSWICLVQEKFRPWAEARLDSFSQELPGIRDRVKIVVGDITTPGLGIPDPGSLPRIQRVQHFAAAYDLNVALPLAQKINVLGTRHVLEFCEQLPALERLDYVSTCYVSGRYPGTFRETDLQMGQKFNNHYESTKYEAEVLVREAMTRGLPASIYRPAIVVGNSSTGQTQKFDGPYFVMQWLLRQGKTAVLPKLGDPDRFTINLVPSDFIVNAIAALCADPASVGQTFHLADPSPLTIRETVRVIAEACGKRLLEIPLPKWLAKSAVGGIPGLERWLGIPRSSLDYFVHPTHYDTSVASAHLSRLGIECPRFERYAGTLVDYMRTHPDTRTRAMI